MATHFKRTLLVEDHVCPWWLAYSFDNPLRRWLHNPQQLLSRWVYPGATVVDFGCGMGHFTLGMAQLVGDSGHVIAVDLQAKMLARVKYRAQNQGVAHRISPVQCSANRVALAGSVDFALTFWMAHEVPRVEALFAAVESLLKSGGRFLLAEPKIHVTEHRYRQIVAKAQESGLQLVEEPPVAFSRAALFAPG